MRLTPYRTSDNRIDGVVLSVLTTEQLGDPGNSRAAREAHTRTKDKKSK